MASTLLLAGLAGVVSHVLYFHRYEQHLYAVQLMLTFLASSGALFGTLHSVYSFSIVEALSTTASIGTSFLVGAYSSTLIWRILLNPLNKFPGPYAARISSLYWSSKLGKADAYLKLEEAHKRYGRFVRIGPNDLSVAHPDAVDLAIGNGARATKAPWYDMEIPFSSMHTTRSKALHDRRRKVWAPAFSDKMLRSYEEHVHRHNDQLVEQFTRMSGKPIDATKWFGLFSFDVMGSLAFGKEYNMLATGTKTKELALMSEGMEPLAQMLPTWLMRALMWIPGMLPGYEKFIKFCDHELADRVKMKPDRTDILTRILEAYKDVPNPEKDPKLRADTKLLIVAGADTTAVTLTFLFYYLSKNPQVVQQIRRELQPLCQGDWSDIDIKSANYLNGAINEALRLFPPVPSGVRRISPPGGLMIGETFIPEGTEFFMPMYVLSRDPAIYTDPEAFIPERWFSKPSMIKHKDAFFPFSLGSMGCIGKNLAYIELRVLTANLVLKFNMALAPGEDGSRLLKETKDHFTCSPGALDLVFTPVA